MNLLNIFFQYSWQKNEVFFFAKLSFLHLNTAKARLLFRQTCIAFFFTRVSSWCLSTEGVLVVLCSVEDPLCINTHIITTRPLPSQKPARVLLLVFDVFDMALDHLTTSLISLDTYILMTSPSLFLLAYMYGFITEITLKPELVSECLVRQDILYQRLNNTHSLTE